MKQHIEHLRQIKIILRKMLGLSHILLFLIVDPDGIQAYIDPSLQKSVTESIFKIGSRIPERKGLYATGFIVEDDILVTDFHVLSFFLYRKNTDSFDDDLNYLYITNPTGKFSIKRFITADIESDLALLQISNYNGSQLSLGISATKKEPAFIIGHHHLKKWQSIEVVKGAETETMDQFLYWTYRDDIPHGMSGSPIIDHKNKVVSVLSTSNTSELEGAKVENIRQLLRKVQKRGLHPNISRFMKRELEELSIRAKQNKIDSLYQMGIHYLYGRNGIPQDRTRGLSLLSKAAIRGPLFAQKEMYNEQSEEIRKFTWAAMGAQKGDPVSQYNLALMYFDGRGIEQNHLKAARWFEHSAKDLFLPAQTWMGILFYLKKGVSPNVKEMVKWTHWAAERNSPYAQYNLGKFHIEGKGVPRDFKKALTWFLKAAEQNFSPGRTRSVDHIMRGT